MFKIERLDPKNPSIKNDFLDLTESSFYLCLEGKNPHNISNTVEIVIGVTKNGKPVGLALASFYKFLSVADIHWLKLDSQFANELISFLEKELIKEGATAVTFTYIENESRIYEKAFEKLQWSKPTLFQIHYEFDALAFDPPWLHKLPSLPSDFELFSWNELTDKERKALLRQESLGIFSSSVSPFGKEEEIIENKVSLGLRHKGNVIGWEVTHRVTPDTVRYTAIFMQKQYLYKGYAIKLLGECMLRHKKAKIPKATFDFTIVEADLTWKNFVKRKLEPYASKIVYRMQVWKKLTF